MKPTPPSTPKSHFNSPARSSINNKNPKLDTSEEIEESSNEKQENTYEIDLVTLIPPRSCRGHTIRSYNFGSYSPSWTIGSSRPVVRPKNEGPGPSDYDTSNYKTINATAQKSLKRGQMDNKLQETSLLNTFKSQTPRSMNRTAYSMTLTTPKSVRNYRNTLTRTSRTTASSSRSKSIDHVKPDLLKENRTITSDIDYINLNDYYSDFGKKSVSIGVRKDTVFWTPTQSPHIIYDIQSTLSRTGFKIGERPKERFNSNPGPGSYSPHFDYYRTDNKKLLTMNKAVNRDVFKIDIPGTPGPGEYEVIKRPKRAPTWFKEKRITKPPNDNDESSHLSGYN